MGRCVVVGEGIVGSSAAYHLAAVGEDVVLVDRDEPGQATAAGAGIVAPGLSTALKPTVEPLARAAVAAYPDLLARLREDAQAPASYDVVGAVHVARSDDEKERLPDTQRLFAERRAAGFENIGDLELVEGDRLRALCPAASERHAGIHASGAARVDGRSLRAAFLQAFEVRGGRRVRGSAAVTADRSRVTGVAVGDERVAADVVVLATGAWPDAVTSASGDDWGIAPQRGQILHLELPDGDTSRWPIFLSYEPYYLLTFPTRRVVVGATREHGTGFDRRVTVAGQQELLHQALVFAPGLADATIVETRVGFRPVTADGVPHIGPVPGCDGLFLATGLGAHGLTLGPYVGGLIASVATGGTVPLDLAPFAPGRATSRS